MGPARTLKQLLIALLLTSGAYASTVTSLGNAYTTTAGSKTVTATPAVNDLIVIIDASTGIAGGATNISDNQSGGTYTKVAGDFTNGTSNGTIAIWVRNNLIGSATSTIFSTTISSDTGGGLQVYSVSGMTRTGSSAIRGSGGQNSGTAATTPAPVLTQAALTGNPVISGVTNASSPGGVTARSSPAYTRDADLGYSTPTSGIDVMHIDSGETASTITWGGTSVTAFASIVVEMDTSAAPTRNSNFFLFMPISSILFSLWF